MVTKARPRFSRAAILAKYPHYWAIRAAADALGLPTRQRRDVTFFDRQVLAKLDPRAPFVWMLRDDGTHLVLASDKPRAGGQVHGADAMIGWLVDSFGHGHKFFTWDGVSLVPCTATAAKAFLRMHSPRASVRAS